MLVAVDNREMSEFKSRGGFDHKICVFSPRFIFVEWTALPLFAVGKPDRSFRPSVERLSIAVGVSPFSGANHGSDNQLQRFS